MSDMRSKKLML